MANSSPASYNVIGLMSGTSLDGLDIAYCNFILSDNSWTYKIIKAETIPYNQEMRNFLKDLEMAGTVSFLQKDVEYGFFLGQRVSDFIIKNDLRPDFVSSHGHTIFHQPQKKISLQVGAGQAIAAKCSLPVVCDFRSLDVALGGQGAPLVPVGDRLLFSEFEYCLNIGGFANISTEKNGNRLAYDICAANIVLNEIAKELGKDFDQDGELAREGLLSNYLLNELNQLPYYKKATEGPKSLGKEWVLSELNPLLEKYELDPRDLLHTYTDHISIQIAKALENKNRGRVLITGGGAYNSYLIERIQIHSDHELVIPGKELVEFKEAMIFAFLGVLRIRKEINCLKTVTGAIRDSCGGSLYYY